MHNDPDYHLIQQTLQGDLLGFEELVRKYQRPVYALCLRFLANREDAKDVSQEVFLNAFTGLPGFRFQASFRTWVYRIAVNACLQFKSKHQEFTELLAAPTKIDSAGPEAVEQAEYWRLVRAHVRRLPKKQRTAIILRLEQGLSYEEIAQITGQTAATVKVTVFYALQKIKKQVQKSNRQALRRIRLKHAKSS